jgi:hypothetical protein
VSGLPSDSVASYESKSAMTIGFCLQVCQGVDPGFDNSSFMGIQVCPVNNVHQYFRNIKRSRSKHIHEFRGDGGA